MTAGGWQLILEELYGVETAASISAEVAALIARVQRSRRPPVEPLSPRDAWLITYADQFQDGERAPLVVLREFLDRHTQPWITGVHVLPFYPWSSDDGFSVKDYLAVDPDYGDWEDIAALTDDRRLMVDAVINHMSAESPWFRGFLDGVPEYAGFFRTADPNEDLSATVRPRTSPLLTRFEGAAGAEHVWTTFSADQVDLDYRNPEVLLRVLGVLLEYIRRGASAIRLDAIAFLWKEEGTSSLHLPQTHAVVHFLRLCVDEAAPGTILITETNVPHAENVSYFGTAERPEAQLVYQFPLAPLVLDAFVEGDATTLASWAAGLTTPVPGTSFLNFLASHDGVGVRPAEGLIPQERVQALADLARIAGGGVGERSLPDGSIVPYELNSTWFDLMAAGHSEEAGIARHLASYAVMFALAGVPLIYVHSLFGSSNDAAGFAATGRPRSYNREKFPDIDALDAALSEPSSRAARLLAGIRAMAMQRGSHPAFQPLAQQQILQAPAPMLAVERQFGEDRALVLINTANEPVMFDLPPGNWQQAADGNPVGSSIRIPGWSSVWLTGRHGDVRHE